MVSQENLVNRRLRNRYKIRKLIARGGMGSVYLAKDERKGDLVAVKHVPFSRIAPPGRDLFESKLLVQLKHDNLPRVRDAFTEKNGHYLVMEYIPGDTLNERLKQGELSSQQVVRYTMDLLAVLDYLHRQKPPIIHRDIKPSNLKFHTDGRLMLVDFGISKQLTPDELTRLGARGALTRGYAPPEQYVGGTDERSDIFAVGGVIYYLLTGKQPPDVQEQIKKRHYHLDPSDVNPSVQPSLAHIVTRATAIKKEHRYPNAGEMYKALRSALFLSTGSQTPIGEVLTGKANHLLQGPAPPAAPATTRPSQTPIILLLLLLILILVLAGIIVILSGNNNVGSLILYSM